MRRLTPRISNYARATVRVLQGAASGSGVVIGHDTATHRAMVLTAWHVVDSGGAIRVTFPLREAAARGRLIAHNSSLDVAAVLIEIDWTPRVAPLHHGEPAADCPIVLAGFGGGKYRQRRGVVLGVVDHRLPRSDLAVSPISIPGDSGGGIFTPEGDVAGILWGGPLVRLGGPMRYTQAVRTDQLRRFVETELKLFPWCQTATTAELQRAIDALQARQTAQDTTLEGLRRSVDELQQQRDTLARAIEQGDNDVAKKILDDVRGRIQDAQQKIDHAQAQATQASAAAADAKDQTSGLRKLIDQAFERIRDAGAGSPNADLLDAVKLRRPVRRPRRGGRQIGRGPSATPVGRGPGRQGSQASRRLDGRGGPRRRTGLSQGPRLARRSGRRGFRVAAPQAKHRRNNGETGVSRRWF